MSSKKVNANVSSENSNKPNEFSISSIPPQSSLSSSSTNGKEIIECQTLTESSMKEIFGSSPTQIEAEASVANLQSFIAHDEGQIMLVEKKFQPLKHLAQFFKMPEVKEAIIKIVSNPNVFDAIWNTGAIQGLLGSCFGFDGFNGGPTSIVLSSNHDNNPRLPLLMPDEERSFIRKLMTWLFDTINTKFQNLVNSLRSLFAQFLPNKKSHSSSFNPQYAQSMIESTISLSIINITIVLIKRAILKGYKIMFSHLSSPVALSVD